MFERTFLIPFYYDSGTVIDYSSGSDFLTSYGSGFHTAKGYGSYDSGSTTLASEDLIST